MKSKLVVIIVGAALCVVGFLGFNALKNHYTFKRGENTAIATQAHAQVMALKPAVAAAETVFVHDTVLLRAKIKSYDSSASAYRHARDTTNIRDTAQVKVALAKADTAVAHADSMKTSCDTTVKHGGSVMYTQSELQQALDRENKAVRALLPGRTERVVTATKWIAFGVALDRLAGVLVPHR